MDVSAFLAILSIVVAIGAVAYSLWAGRGAQKQDRNAKYIEELKFKLGAIERKLNSDSYIIDTIAGALHSIDNRQTTLLYISTMEDETGCLKEEEAKQFNDLQKKLTELGLFSEDKIRRTSVQRALAHVDGDAKSLVLMSKIDKGELGIRDDEIVGQIDILKKRLEKASENSDVWPGRPGGGEF